MYAGRLLIMLLLILAMVAAYSPQARAEVQAAWTDIRPVAVALLDNLYAVVRGLIAGNETDDRMHDEPVPPGLNVDRIVTGNSGFSF